jgi:hypothetical protein
MWHIVVCRAKTNLERLAAHFSRMVQVLATVLRLRYLNIQTPSPTEMALKILLKIEKKCVR